MKTSNWLLFISILLGACQATEDHQEHSKAEPVVAFASNTKQLDERKYTLLEREMEYLMTIWPGEYDNVEQLDFDKFGGRITVEKGQHLRVHSIVQRVDLNSFGEYVIYEEAYQNDRPEELFRRAIYVLTEDKEKNAIRINIHHFKDQKGYLSIGNALPDFLPELNPVSNLLETGCPMLLRREGMAFRGSTIDKDCISNPEQRGQSLDHQISISENEYWYEDIVYDKDQRPMLSSEQQPYMMEKARQFVCMVDFPREKGGRPVETKHYIDIHDQGGKFEFDYTDGRHMVLGMRNTWSFGMQRETFVIFIQEGSQEGPTLIYSWGEPGADRIGFNPGWIRVQCDLDTPKNRALQHALRPDS